MLDKLKPYPLDFIQKASPGKGDAFDYAYIYKFYTERTAIAQRLKYIIRVEAYEDVFAVKFYAARDRKLDNKYNRILRVHTYSSVVRVFFTCASIVSTLYPHYPYHSYIISGAESNDLKSDKVEGKDSNQRFRIYRTMALQLFGRKVFEHYQQKQICTYMLINRHDCPDIEQKAERIKQMFFDRGFDM